jgi:hypothetical protein
MAGSAEKGKIIMDKHMAFPETIRGDGPIVETVTKVAEDPFFGAIPCGGVAPDPANRAISGRPFMPVRYAVNILEAGWRRQHHPESIAYEAALVDSGDSGRALFAYEWINPRFGKPVKEIRLRRTVADNPITLAGLRVVKNACRRNRRHCISTDNHSMREPEIRHPGETAPTGAYSSLPSSG